MNGPSDLPDVVAAPNLAPEDVADWLQRHPDFLLRYPELAATMVPPARHDGAPGVVDLQRFMVERLQGQLARANGAASQLIAASRANMSIQTMVHQAVLALLDATTFEHLVHIATQDMAQLLGIDAVTICVEGAGAKAPRVPAAGVYVLAPGAVDARLGAGRDVVLIDDAPGDEAIFGPAATLVRSQALARLSFGRAAPPGLLALGAREAGLFHPGQGTELLAFLAQAVGRCVRRWLDLPPG
jgi:hypothetical protein